jgi:hypothetical protein
VTAGKAVALSAALLLLPALAGGCKKSKDELAKPSIAAALMKLDEAERNVRTTASNATLDTLRKQVKNVQNACP